MPSFRTTAITPTGETVRAVIERRPPKFNGQ